MKSSAAGVGTRLNPKGAGWAVALLVVASCLANSTFDSGPEPVEEPRGARPAVFPVETRSRGHAPRHREGCSCLPSCPSKTAGGGR